MYIDKHIKKIKQERYDLSDYLIHFTKNNAKKTAYEVLKDIIKSGRLNCDWGITEKNGATKNTIFGKFPAICFTEMPLFSFEKYVNNRNNKNKIDFYGIAVNKSIMFKLGARNVIYGTTNENEREDEYINEDKWLPEKEKYRYMMTDINKKNDWTHEREWRWTNQYKMSNGDYLPIWIIDKYDKDFGDSNFYQEAPIFIILRKENEIAEIIKIFNTFKNDSQKYNVYNINQTYAISLEELNNNGLMSYDKLDFNSLIKDNICKKINA